MAAKIRGKNKRWNRWAKPDLTKLNKNNLYMLLTTALYEFVFRIHFNLDKKNSFKNYKSNLITYSINNLK